jgi:hypothetical protein
LKNFRERTAAGGRKKHPGRTGDTCSHDRRAACQRKTPLRTRDVS